MITVGINKNMPIGIMITKEPIYNYPPPDDAILELLRVEPTLPCATVESVTTDVYNTEGYDEILMMLPDNWTTITSKEFNQTSFDISSINTVDVSKMSILIDLVTPERELVTCRQDPLPEEGLMDICPQENLFFDAKVNNYFNHSIEIYDRAYVTFFSYSFI